MYEAQKEAKQYIRDMVEILQGLNGNVDADMSPLQAEEVADSLDCLRGVVKNMAAGINEHTPKPVDYTEGAECVLQMQRVLRAFTRYKQQFDCVHDLLLDNDFTPEEFETITSLGRLMENKIDMIQEQTTQVMLNYIKSRLDKNA